MITNRNLVSAVGLAMAMALSSANAAEAGFYVGVQGGQATADLDQEELDFLAEDVFLFAGVPLIAGTGSSSLDDGVTTWSVTAGYRLNPYLALEASYLDLGTFEYRAGGLVNPPGPVTSLQADLGIDFSSTGFTTAVIGGIPLGESFDLHGKLGIFFSETEIEVSVAGDVGNGSDGISSSDTDVFYGAGVSWFIGANWTLGLDYLLYKDVGNEDDTGETDVESVTLLAAYRF
ncbi:outer membrane beta-barrel protein [Povalibacter sp.]|uniref:outer membrane beta-barrel protein n=1 Tax=Povalibacter sp. TaxID=1962978 RepID=UPI002F3F063A